jgi:hypothetical protein
VQPLYLRHLLLMLRERVELLRRMRMEVAEPQVFKLLSLCSFWLCELRLLMLLRERVELLRRRIEVIELLLSAPVKLSESDSDHCESPLLDMVGFKINLPPKKLAD